MTPTVVQLRSDQWRVCCRSRGAVAWVKSQKAAVTVERDHVCARGEGSS